MPSEKKNVPLKSTEYEIGGNSVRAFYDANGKLVFVLDLTTNDIKPNVLLVMTSHGNRKWDDVLANDYGMNLELVRPKKDNKYQKLDVEYDGLAVYDDLIRAYENGDNLDEYLNDLAGFRVAAVRNSATERIGLARAVMENAQDTIDKTSDSIVELQAKIKAARAKIANLRRGIGREPTKESAAKILKAEAALDALNDKLARAKKRLENANKRLLSAQEDMAAAQSVLDLLPRGRGDKKHQSKTGIAPVASVAAVRNNDAVARDNVVADVDDASDLDTDVDAEMDADYDMDVDNTGIKPLFDKDPNILDDKIAFKPIDFGASTSFDVDENVSGSDVSMGGNVDTDLPGIDESDDDTDNKTDDVDDGDADDADNAPAVAFEPPRAIMDAVKLPDEYNNADVKLDDVFWNGADDDVSDTAPVTDMATEQIATNDAMDADDGAAQDTHNAPVLDSLQNINFVAPGADNENASDDVATDDTVKPTVAAPAPVAPDVVAAPAPVVAATNVDAGVRPSVPGAAPQVVNDIPKQTTTTHKPGLLYYVLLMVLIALSVFTLWLYHRSNVSNDVMPTVVAENSPTIATPADVDVTDDTNPFIASGDVVTSPAKPILTQAVETSLDKIADATDTTKTSDVTSNVADDVSTNNDVIDTVVAPDVEPMIDATDASDMGVAPVVNKPEYNVSQENVFTSSDNGGGNLCAGDVAPDANGCCPGETYSTVNGQKVCCPDDGMDCFPPLF
ncbi:MAG: hypothetical protein ACLRFM_02140 [Alphaproteobacteria bacterium]